MSADLGDEKKNSPSTSFITNSQPSTSSDFRLDLFGRHIPKILSKQLMGKLFDQFINQTGEHDSDQVGAFSCIPSIARFDAALLFVDISGFTVLSQKLPVDELRVSINSYFKIIIDTVMRYNGDVIKFAGDALFIVFQADSDDSPSKGSNQSDRMRQAITTAINCGVEINRLCTNYRIDLNKKKEKTQLNDSLTSLILSHDAPPSLLDPMSPFTSQSSDMDHTFLNVHSGCAAGTLGGIDVGAMDRWEYLIIGQPLQDISEAESVAEKGELVLTEYAHDLYCLGALNPDKTYNIVTEDGPPAERVAAEPAEDVIMPCGCRRTYNNCYRLKEKVRSHVEAPQVEEELEEEDYELQYYRDVVNCASVAFDNGKHIVMRKFYEYLSQEVETTDLSNKLKTDLENTTTTSTSKKSPDVLMSTSLPVLPSAAPQSNSFNHLSSKTNSMQISDVNFVHDFYLKWIINCLTADFGRHVHEADRGPYEVAKIHRINCIEQCAKAYQDALTSGVNLNSQNTYVDNERDSSESFVRRIRNIVNNAHKSPHPQHHRPSLENIHHTRQNSHNNYLREQNQKKHEKLLKNDHELTGELRNVIMMFISIRSLSSSTPRPSILKKTLYFRPNDDYDEVDGCALDAFHFKRRSKVEKDSDKKLRNHYQTCMSLIVSSLKEQGGQLRQFIVDDKGTVAIGSFGLRGSATYDNAASAVEAALSIIGHLQNVGLNASIGITSGRAYCGAVGSLRRHEYAVMGPSVNLSARLMGKGKPGEIICDASTRSVDRLHSYRPIGEIKAKGYENPVAIFKPVFLRGSATNMSNIPRLLSADYGLGVNEAGVTITPGLSSNRDKITSREGGRTKRLQSKRLIGRDQEELQALEAILQNVLQLDEQHDHHHALHQICKDIQANLLETPYGLSVDTSLNTSCYSRIVVVNGTSGMGKSALITSLCDKLSEYSKISTWNLEILHGKSSNLTTSDPFKPWRTIIRAILGQFARYENIVKERREAEIDVPDSSLLAKKWKKGLDYVSSYLSEEEKALLPLLTAAHILPGLPETDVTKKLNGQEKLEYVIKVLQAILKYYPQLTNNVLLIVLDDSHSMDAHSWKLVHEVLLKNSGIIFLAGYYDEDDDSQSLSSASSSTISSSSLSRNQRHNRDHHGSILRHQSCRQIRLGGLDTTSIKLMMNNILEGYVDLSFMDPAVAEALQEMSGGNPLYIYEICLASLEKIRAKSAPLDLSSPNSIDSITMERYILDFRTNRIDEVIYYRFDRLDAQSQLILKMGAIITASNSHRGFNLEMLMHLLHHDEKGFASPDVLDGFFSCLTIDPSSPARNVKKGGRRRASTFMKDPAYLQAALQLYNKIQEMVASSTFIKVVHTHRRTSFQSNEELLEAQDHFPGAITPPPHGLLLSQPPSFIDLNHQNTRESDETGLTRTLSMFTGFNEEQFCKDMVEICYDFNISLERKTIYDLMLDDQKESLHDRVATYLEKENEEAYQLHHITFSDLNEEAYHWEKATIWGNAMSGYYRAGMLLYGLGALREAHEYFGNSYRMLLMLRRDAKIKESSYTSIKLDELLAELEFINKEKEKESLRRQKSLEQRRRSKETNAIKEETERDEEENEMEGQAGILISEEVIDSRLSAKNQLTHGDYALTKIDIYNTFGGDSNLLEIAVNLLLRLGQTALFLGEQVVITSAIFEDALRLMLLTWPRKHDHRDDQRDFTELPQSSSDDKGNPRIQMKRQRSNMRGSGGMSILDVKAKMDSFKLKDPSICFPIVSSISFPIVSSISLLYRGRRLQDDEDNSKEWSLYSILLNLAKSSLLHYRVHYVQAIALMSSFSIERAKYDQAIAYLTEIKTWYNPSAYHPQLVHLYGEDRIPAAIANIAQMMLLQGYLPHAMVVLKELHLLGEKLEHQFSVGMLSNALSSIYLLCGNFSEAEKVFLLSRNGKRRSPRDRFVGNHEEVLGEMTDLMIDFFTLTKMVEQEEYNEVIKMIFTSKPLLPHSSPHHHSSTPLHDNHNGRHTPSPHSSLGSHHSTPHAAHHEERTVLGRLSKIVQRHYLNNANISVVWDAAANFGLGVEYLCAQITVAVALAMFKTNHKSDEITAKDMLLLGSEYYDAAIAKVGSSHRLLAYYLLLMLSKIEVLVHLYLYPEELVEKKEEVLSELLSCLKDLGKKIDENGFTFMYLRLIKLLQELKADSFLSEGVLKEVFIGVIGEKGEMPKRVEEEGGGGGSLLTQMEEGVFTQLEGKICDYHLQQTKEFQELFQSSFSGVMLDQIHDGVSEAKGEEHQLILLLRQYTTNLFTK